MADSSPLPLRHKTQPIRPQLGGARRGSSYLSDHQQFRSPVRSPEPQQQSQQQQPGQHHQGIDTVLERSSPPPHVPFNGIPSKEHPPTIIDGGVTHAYSHPNCAPPAGTKSDRLVATLVYRPRDKRVDGLAASGGDTFPGSGISSTIAAALAAKSLPASESAESLPVNLAPTTNLDNYPMEPPTQNSDHLDHIYGSYISPLCITSFLHLMSTFPLAPDADEPSSSHRCLDNQETPRVVELTLSPAPSPEFLTLSDLRKHETLYNFEQEWNVDVVLQKDTVWRRHPRLVVFDMDSTLITQEVIDLLAENVHEPPDLPALVADITRRAMLGELEFDASFRERVKLLKGLDASIFQKLQPILDVTPGVRELIKALKRLGVKTAVLSGGFLPLTGWLAKTLGIDYAFANEVVIGADGKLTGEVQGVIVGKERKRDLLVEIAAKENIDLSQTVAVGDGANDLLMLAKAGLGVAWNAKPRVQMEASARLNGESLLDLLYLFGFTGEEIEHLVL